MKKVMWGVIIGFLLIGPMKVMADSVQGGDVAGIGSDPIKTLLVSANTNSAGTFQSGSLILGFKLYANDAGDVCGLYDGTTTGGSATLIDELIEPTDEDVSLQMWPRPYKLTTDLSVWTNGICIIYYQ